jgi:hypothetical protein
VVNDRKIMARTNVWTLSNADGRRMRKTLEQLQALLPASFAILPSKEAVKELLIGRIAAVRSPSPRNRGDVAERVAKCGGSWRYDFFALCARLIAWTTAGRWLSAAQPAASRPV